MIHTVKGFGVVNKAEIDAFLKLSCFFNDPADVGNLISGSSASSKTSLNICKFMVHILLKPDLGNFEHYFTGMWDKWNCAVVWTFFGIAFLWDWNGNYIFQSCGHCWVFQICWHIKYSTFTASSFRIWNSSTGIPSDLFQILNDDAVKVLRSICQQIWKTQQWPQDWKKSVFIPIPKKGNAKECSNYHTIAVISHASKWC